MNAPERRITRLASLLATDRRRDKNVLTGSPDLEPVWTAVDDIPVVKIPMKAGTIPDRGLPQLAVSR